MNLFKIISLARSLDCEKYIKRASEKDLGRTDLPNHVLISLEVSLPNQSITYLFEKDGRYAVTSSYESALRYAIFNEIKNIDVLFPQP